MPTTSKKDRSRALDNFARAMGALDAGAEDLGGPVRASNESADPLVVVRRRAMTIKDEIAELVAMMREELEPGEGA